jgi:ABC-type transport system substrate-binding protein
MTALMTALKKKTPFIAALLIASQALSLAACGNDPYGDEVADQKILYTSFREAPKTLDPAVSYTTAGHQFIGVIYETLVEYHYLKRPYELVPGLAKSLPEIQNIEGGIVEYRFSIRDGVLFQEDPAFEAFGSGATRSVTAADFEFQFKRLADPQVNSPIVSVFERVAGFGAFRKRLSDLRKNSDGFASRPIHEQYEAAGDISGVIASGLDLRVRLREVFPQILYWFAMPFTTAMPWEAVAFYDGDEGRPHLREHPVGSGPYRMTRYDKQYKIVLEKNPSWYGVMHPEWRAPGATFPTGDFDTGADYAGRSLPFIDRVEYRREKEAIPKFNKFLQGYYDYSGVIEESFDRVVQSDQISPDMAALGMSLRKTVSPDIFYIGFNMLDPVIGAPAGDVGRKLRQAMSLVIDVDEYKRLFNNGRGVPAHSLLPPGIFGYDSAFKNPYRKVDIERAKTLMAEAGYPNGIDRKTGAPLKLTIDSADTSPRGYLEYQFYVDAWRQIGLDVEISATNYNQFQEKMRIGGYQIFRWGWVADYPDPENFFFLLDSQNGRKKSGGENVSNFENPQFDQAFHEMRNLPNGSERKALIRKLREILVAERPWIELLNRESYLLHHEWIKNIEPFGMSVPMMKYWDIDVEARRESRLAWNKPILWPAYALVILFAVIVAPGIRTFFRERQ